MKKDRVFLYQLKNGVKPKEAQWVDQTLICELTAPQKGWYKLVQGFEEIIKQGLELNKCYLIQTEDDTRQIKKSEFIEAHAICLDHKSLKLKLVSRSPSIILKGK